MTDGGVRRRSSSALDRAVAAVDGHGFRDTPFAAADRARRARSGSARGRLWVKDETGNVSGSHKARHLMGLLLVARGGARGPGSRGRAARCRSRSRAAATRRWRPRWSRAPRTARSTSSCPPTRDPRVVERLACAGRPRSHVCERAPGGRRRPLLPRASARAVAAGALPFSARAATTGSRSRAARRSPTRWSSALRRTAPCSTALFVQVGGGALASACVQGFATRSRSAALPRCRASTPCRPRRHPLARAWDRLAARILGECAPRRRAPSRAPTVARAGAARPLRADALGYAAHHRSEFMWPWERSRTASPRHPRRRDLRLARRASRDGRDGRLAAGRRGSDPERGQRREPGRPPGSPSIPPERAGLAGLVELVRQGEVATEARSAVLFTGRSR